MLAATYQGDRRRAAGLQRAVGGMQRAVVRLLDHQVLYRLHCCGDSGRVEMGVSNDNAACAIRDGDHKLVCWGRFARQPL
jgi:hypothetical protein